MSANQDRERSKRIERVMAGFEELIRMGYLVPKLDDDGKPEMRDGQPVYEASTDPAIIAQLQDPRGGRN